MEAQEFLRRNHFAWLATMIGSSNVVVGSWFKRLISVFKVSIGKYDSRTGIALIWVNL